ncbi:NAD(P)-dependent oxidoreductase [Microlunatus flavus]|uniref:Phosphoglycerate dehydrogenase n=1 Tax=Microlunatus flavus TaxID=1036181 RepID=A0A1H8ZLP5_9ACTN|nr:NAD(P)-dependent oxidoreductase [Microlunatus flavus]SEP65224.1 Phosphoglycerate dehydrogenase [Microlunatus flavus]
MKPVVVLVPQPQPVERIFRPETLARLRERFTVVEPAGADGLDAALPDAWAVVGQPDLPTERLDRAPDLRAVVNVEGNFYPNIDYPTAFARSIRVLGCGPAYAQAVAEHALGLALDLARGISREDRAFREGRERYLGEGNADAVLLRHADVGLVGYGNLGRALRPLLAPFAPTLRVYDPWLPDAVLREADATPAGLDEVLSSSRFVFVLATVTGDSEHLLGARELDLLPDGARLVLVSRAAVTDYDALAERVAAGRFLAASDVWPEEPVPADSPFRSLEGVVLSAHRAGGIPAAFLEIGDMVVDDLELMAAGLAPVRLQQAAPELVGRYRNRPAG